MCIALVTVTMERRPIARFRLYTGKVLMYGDEAEIYLWPTRRLQSFVIDVDSLSYDQSRVRVCVVQYFAVLAVITQRWCV